jgi:hypothetical protein
MTTPVAVGIHLNGIAVVDEFVDRPAEMQQLWEQLQPQPERPQRRTLLIHGEAGVGKSQLAVAFARKNGAHFGSVFRVDGRAEESLKWGIAGIQHHLKGHKFSSEAQAYAQSESNLNRAVSEVLEWFSLKKNNRWLLVIDDLATKALALDNDGQNFNLKAFLPMADHGSVLITTRRSQGHEYEPSLELGILNADQAETLWVEMTKEHLQGESAKTKKQAVGGI